MNQFNDEKLIGLAKSLYYTSGNTPPKDVLDSFGKAKLSNQERNALVDFISANSFTRPISMTQMKREILTAIGRTDVLVNYSNVLSRNEVQAIYEYFMKYLSAKKVTDGKQ